ncbi:heat shock factor binding protein 1-domain-containing protein [Nemania serpens]|nr:heat shock factor binding protein 1-domain-containing protein [Nemania serpens]
MSSKKQEDNTTSESGKSSDELTAVVEELLNSLSNKFTTVSGEIFSKNPNPPWMMKQYGTNTQPPTVDEMARRLDSLEAALRANEEKPPGSPSKA